MPLSDVVNECPGCKLSVSYDNGLRKCGRFSPDKDPSSLFFVFYQSNNEIYDEWSSEKK